MRYTIEYYLTSDGKNIAGYWLKGLRDTMAKVKITKRISCFENGNFGDVRYLRNGVTEMRVDEGKGYRIYYAEVNGREILLLCGGDKTTQDADIATAINYFQDWKKRPPDDE